MVGYLQPGSYAGGFASSGGWTPIEYPPYGGDAWVHSSDVTALSCEA